MIYTHPFRLVASLIEHWQVNATPGDFLQVKLSKTVTFLPRSAERIRRPFPATVGFSFGATQQT